MRLRGQLETNEHLIVGTRSHPVTLLPAVATLLTAAAIASFASSVMPTARFLAYLTLVLACWLTILAVSKILRWATTSYLLTNYRLVIQSGLLQSQQHSIPLNTVEAVDLKARQVNVSQQADLSVFSHGRPYSLPRIPYAAEYSRQIFKAQQQIIGTPFSQ